MKKIIALLLLLATVVSAQQTAGTTTTPTLDPGQIYTTGNIVQQTTTGSGSTWVGAVYQDQLTCWAGGDPGYCGPSAIVRPGNYLNFSYGSTYVYQQQHITNILPSGTGLQVNGYNFSFTAKNGNGWDDGRTDNLMALVRFWDNTGSKGTTNLLYGNVYSLNYKFDWTNFNYSENFTKPLAVPDVGLVQYGFIGSDNNFWAGPYGPEIMNVSFSVKYSVDPCLKDPLFSSSCPGYTDALLKSLPVVTTPTVDPVTTSTTSAGSTTTTAIVTDPVSPTVTTTSTTTVGQPSVVASVVSAPAPVTTSSSSATSSSTSSSSTTQSTKESIQSSGGNVSLALSIISKNQDRDAAGSAVAQAAVSQAQQAATQAQQEAQSVATSAVTNSLSANAVSTGSQQSSGNGIRMNNINSNSSNFTLQSGQTSVASLNMGPQTNNILVQQQSSNTGISVASNQPIVVASVSTQQQATSSFALPLVQPQTAIIVAPVYTSTQTEQQTQKQTVIQSNSITSNNEPYSIVPPNFLTDKSNPLTDIIENKQNIPQSNTIATVGPSVNKNVGDNEVAGGVDLNKMTTAPQGYGDYLNFTMRDVAFYAPKEVYKNQRNVDNQRALRLLTNDSKHREMVEMQYVK